MKRCGKRIVLVYVFAVLLALVFLKGINAGECTGPKGIDFCLGKASCSQFSYELKDKCNEVKGCTLIGDLCKYDFSCDQFQTKSECAGIDDCSFYENCADSKSETECNSLSSEGCSWNYIISPNWKGYINCQQFTKSDEILSGNANSPPATGSSCLAGAPLGCIDSTQKSLRFPWCEGDYCTTWLPVLKCVGDWVDCEPRLYGPSGGDKTYNCYDTTKHNECEGPFGSWLINYTCKGTINCSTITNPQNYNECSLVCECSDLLCKAEKRCDGCMYIEDNSCIESNISECIPDCTGKECGFDGCGGQCGTCAAGMCNSEGKCVIIKCSQKSDCGIDGLSGNKFCSNDGKSVYQNYAIYNCRNPGAQNSFCLGSISPTLIQTCPSEQVCFNGQCVPSTIPMCTLPKKPTWSQSSINLGESVNLSAETKGCYGYKLNFTIKNSTNIIYTEEVNIESGDKPTKLEWTPEKIGTYTFNATIKGIDSKKSSNLIVKEIVFECEACEALKALTCIGNINCSSCALNPITNKCEFNYTIPGKGTCTLSSTIISSCETSDFLEYSWTGKWSGPSEAGDCKNGSNKIPCPEEVQLPLTSLFGILLTIGILILIYGIIIKKNKY